MKKYIGGLISLFIGLIIIIIFFSNIEISYAAAIKESNTIISTQEIIDIKETIADQEEIKYKISYYINDMLYKQVFYKIYPTDESIQSYINYWYSCYYDLIYSEFNETEIILCFKENIGRKICDLAWQCVDVLPYVWGGHSLEYGADCSGFVSALYAAYGYNISTGSNVLAYTGYSVSYEAAQPGDIVIYGYGDHVALYIGNGQIIHEPGPGSYCTVSDINYMNYTDIRRIIN